MTMIESAADAVRWEAPAFNAGPPPLVDIAQIEQAARDDGFARGHAEGLLHGQAEARRLVARLENLVDAFIRPLAGLDGEIEQALAALATGIAGTLVGAKYAAEPECLTALVREAIQSAGDTTRPVEVRLHPDDVTMLRPLLPDVSRLVADVTLARGDVRVHADAVRIDARLDTRLKKVLEDLTVRP